MFYNFPLYMFRLFLWLTIPAAVYGFISSSSSCAISSSTISCGGNYFVYHNGHQHHHIDTLLEGKHASAPFLSFVKPVFFLRSSSSLPMNLYSYYGRREIKNKSPISTTVTSARRDTSTSTTTTISATIPRFWTSKSSTTQLYARGGKKKRNVSSKTKKSESSTYSIEEEEEDTYSSPYTASSKNKNQLNRKERMEILLSQHGKQCIWCNTPITISTATTDHIIPKIKGGPSWIENELASCYKCNKARGHIPALDYVDIMKEKGLFVNQDAIIQKLQELDIAIEERGGQRKARPHLYRQLRRLDRM